MLVNNAGNFYAGYFEELTPEQIDAQLAVTLLGPMNVTRAVLPVMRKQRSGHIVTITSTAGIVGGETTSSYAAAKFGAEGWMESLAPKMLELAGERTAGTHTYFVPLEHTRAGRQQLGPGKLIAVELACVVDTDPARAKAVAREYAKLYLGLRNYVQNLLRHGFSDDDVADGGSDRLIDALVPQGSAAEIAEIVHAHLDAGADHVCLQPLGEDGIPRDAWTALAEALI